MTLLDDIAAFIQAHKLSESKFGEEALKDRRFVANLRAGRSPSLNTAHRVNEFMLTYPNHAPYESRKDRAAA